MESFLTRASIKTLKIPHSCTQVGCLRIILIQVTLLLCFLVCRSCIPHIWQNKGPQVRLPWIYDSTEHDRKRGTQREATLGLPDVRYWWKWIHIQGRMYGNNQGQCPFLGLNVFQTMLVAWLHLRYIKKWFFTNRFQSVSIDILNLLSL